MGRTKNVSSEKDNIFCVSHNVKSIFAFAPIFSQEKFKTHTSRKFLASLVFNFLAFAIAENREIKGSINVGDTADSIADRVWLVLQAVGDIAFAYPYTTILLEIQVCGYVFCV